jgi:hypothetical protein
MKLPRVRFTVRRMMVAVAVVGLAFGVTKWIKGRRDMFESLADDYLDEGSAFAEYGHGLTELNPRSAWNWAMYLKYKQAARHPWFPVAPDPPEPE